MYGAEMHDGDGNPLFAAGAGAAAAGGLLGADAAKREVRPQRLADSTTLVFGAGTAGLGC